MSKVLITGGSGFLAKALIKRLGPIPVRIMARNEGELIKTQQQFPAVEIFPGDLADQLCVNQACQGIDTVFHLGAFKHAPMAETFSRECVKSNVIGSMNVLDASVTVPGIKVVVGISTDKAEKVTGTYAASKFIMEKLFEQYSRINLSTTYHLVRFGNVLFSTGSVITKWRDQIRQNKPCIVTDFKSTRFYWTADQAVDHIFSVTNTYTSCHPIYPKMRAIRLFDLYTAAVEMFGDGYCQQPIEIGLQKGENLHEYLSASVSSEHAEKYSKEEIMDLLRTADLT